MNEQDFVSINLENLSCSTSITNLPSAKEYREATLQFSSQWSEPKYKCPKCGGYLKWKGTLNYTDYIDCMSCGSEYAVDIVYEQDVDFSVKFAGYENFREV